jgi:hypothetical protein
MSTVVVLNDGETYTDISGCRIIFMPEDPDYPMFDVIVRNRYDSGIEVLDTLRVYEAVGGHNE